MKLLMSHYAFIPGMVLSKKQPSKPPTNILVLQITVNTLSNTSFPV